MRHILAIVGLIAVSHVTMARPAVIVLLRHAEKPADDRNPDLSMRGWQRANALPSFITNSAAITANGRPAALFAARPTRHGHSQRAELTLNPLARTLRLPVQTPCDAEDYRSLARKLLRDPDLDGKTVLICWVHDYIPQLAEALGVRSPPDWKKNDFDHAWVITFDQRDGAQLKIVPERLLAGDKKR